MKRVGGKTATKQINPSVGVSSSEFGPQVTKNTLLSSTNPSAAKRGGGKILRRSKPGGQKRGLYWYSSLVHVTAAFSFKNVRLSNT